MKLQGCAAVVIGGANGMGKCYCNDLLKNGVKVLLCDINETDGMATTIDLSKINNTSDVTFRKCDGSNEDDIRGCMQEALTRWGRLDIVVNHVGIFNEQNWRPMFNINYGSAVLTANIMEDLVGKSSGGPGGVLIHTSSRAGVIPAHLGPIYSGTKAAMVQYTRALMHPTHYNRHGIRMMCICPGITKTNMADDILASADKHGRNHDIVAAITHLKAMDAWNKPEDVSAVLITLIERDEELAGCAAVITPGQPVEYFYRGEWDHLKH